MSTYDEKLGILSQLIAFARVDETVKESEYDFMFNVAQHLGVSKKSFDDLFHNSTEEVVLKGLGDRLVQFHRLLLLMNIDQQQSLSELKSLHEIGLKMGLSPSAIDQVLETMHLYPNNAIPADKLIEIFKSHYN